MQVHVVRTYEHIPPAILSQDVVLAPSPGMKVGGSGSITQSSTTHTSGGGVGLPSPKHHQDQLAVHQMRARAGLLERDDSGSSLSHHTHLSLIHI